MTMISRRECNGVLLGILAAPLAVHGFARAQSGSTIAGVRIGTQSYSFRDRSLDDAIAAMQRLGIGFCELWQDHVETRERVNAPGDAGAEQRREALRRWRLAAPLDLFHEVRGRFDAAGIRLTAYNLSFRDDFTDDEIRRGFEMARALGVDTITASSTLGVVPRLDAVAREFGIRVGLHNHSKIAPNEFATAADFAAAMKGMSGLIGVNLDIGHFTAADFDALGYLDEHHDRIVSLHIKDRRRGQGPNVPFGQGDTPIVAVLQRLRDRRWDIPAHIEYEYEGLNTIDEVRRCLEYCRTALVSPTTRERSMQRMVGWVLMGLVVAAGSVRPAQAQATPPAAQQQPSANTLSPAERAAGWRLLFDGTSTKGWRGFRQKAAPDGWQAVEGTLSRVRTGADLITVDQFDSFELALEWKIAPGGNSGIMFRVSEDEEATYHTGPEMQVLDNGRHPDGKAPLTSAGSCYGLYAPVKDTTKPVGEWNAVRLIVNGNHVEHWLNDVKVVEYELGSPEWTKLVRSSKFNEWPRYGRVPRGHIALQDHGDLVSYRNIKIRSIGSR